MESITLSDTGKETPTSTASLTTVDAGNEIEIPAGIARFEMDSLTESFDSRHLDRTLGIFSYYGNKVTAVKPTRITIPCIIPTTASGLEIFTKLQLMQRTLGLKKLKGGLGTIACNPNVNTDGSIYVIITSIKPSENLGVANDAIKITMTLEQVVE